MIRVAKLFDTFVACGSVLLLAVTLVAAGFAAVAVPDWATVALSRAFSGCDQPHTPFTANELTAMAVAGKHYTFDSNNAEELSSAVAAANASAEADGRANKMGEHSEARSLPTDAISHLDDVYRVVSVAKPLLFVVAIICIAGLAHVAVRINRRALGRVLTAGGAAVLVVFAMLGAWATVDFNGLFSIFHSLFFQAGTWTFSYDSLLITMYPTAFWMGMAAIWLVVTCAASILCILTGRMLSKQAGTAQCKTAC